MPKSEFRAWGAEEFDPGVSVETRDDGSPMISGLGAKYGRWYDVGGYFQERIMPGAIAKSLQEAPDIRGMFNHDPNFLLGRTGAGTMTVSENRRGIKYDIKASPNDPQAVSVVEKIRRGDVDGASIMFHVTNDDWDESGKIPKRTITEIRLVEVGPVVFPANPGATAALRSTLPDFEGDLDFDFLRRCLVKRRFKHVLSADERNVVEESVQRLQQMIEEPLTPSAEHSERDWIVSQSRARAQALASSLTLLASRV